MEIAVVERTDLYQGKDLPIEKIELKHLKPPKRDQAPCVVLRQANEFRVLKDDENILLDPKSDVSPTLSEKAETLVFKEMGADAEGVFITGEPKETKRHPFHFLPM